MTARLGETWRSGNRKEDLGICLLKGMAAVAPVPRTEDLGIDAIATLLRKSKGNLLIADASFNVQFKSSNDRSIEFEREKDAITWLKAIELPFLIGSVDGGAARIDLFTCHNVHAALFTDSFDVLELHLDEPKKKPDKKRCDVYVGPPLFSWTVSDTFADDFVDRAFAVMKPCLEIERMNHIIRRSGIIQRMVWKTNEPAKTEGVCCTAKVGSQESVRAILQHIYPEVFALITQMVYSGKAKDEVIHHLRRVYHENGIDLDLNMTIERVAADMLLKE